VLIYIRILVASYLKSKKPTLLVSTAIRRPFRLGLPVFACMMITYAFSNAGVYDMGYQDYTENIKLNEWPCIDHPNVSLGWGFYDFVKMFSYAGFWPWYQGGVLWY
jgi:hypothetical protein